MNTMEQSLCCPYCNSPLAKGKLVKKCGICFRTYKKSQGIWEFLIEQTSEEQKSNMQYDKLHKKHFAGPNDGSYEILAAMALGNKTVDIACGQGHIEKLSPETVGVEFSLNALKKAKANGAKYLVHADAHALPFTDNAFDIAISAGNLEHFTNPQKAINEMARVSRIQVLTVHRSLPFPFSEMIRNFITRFFKVKHQPIERPISIRPLEKMFTHAGLQIIFQGVWTLPVNYGRVVTFLPEFKKIPSCWFIMSVKRDPSAL